MSLKSELHDRLWNAFQRWHALRESGVTHRDLKMRGIRECGDPNRFTRPLIFCGNTLRTYEKVLRDFIDFAQRDHGATRLEDIGKKEFRAYMDRGIAQGLAVKTLSLYRSALAKFGSAVTRQTESFAALSEKYGWKIRQLAKLGQLPGPARMPGLIAFAQLPRPPGQHVVVDPLAAAERRPGQSALPLARKNPPPVLLSLSARRRRVVTDTRRRRLIRHRDPPSLWRILGCPATRRQMVFAGRLR